MSYQSSRRHFIQQISLGMGATLAGTSLVSWANESKGVDKKLGVALVGLGSYAEHQLATGLEQTKNCYLAGIVTGTPSKIPKWKAKYNIPDKNIYNYDNFDRIADNKDIDIVYIVLPNSMHHEYVIRAARAGKHVMCEKPMSVSVRQAEEMIKACNEAGVQLGIGYRLHFEPFSREIMRIGQQKVFGDVRFIQPSFGFSIGDPTQWRLKKDLAGGGPLMDVGIYCVQASRYVTGKEPLWVTAQFGPITDAERFREVEESVSWQMEFPDGVMVNGFTSYKSNIEELYVSATKGWVRMSPAYSYGPIRGRTQNGDMNFPVVHHQAAMLDGIAASFIQSGRFPDHINGQEGLRDMKYLMAIYEAAASGKRIRLQE